MTDLSGPTARLQPEPNLMVPPRRGFERTDRSHGTGAFCDMCRMRLSLVSRLPARRGRAKVHKSARGMFSTYSDTFRACVKCN